jgi:class 3 adenylate cyclase
MGVQLGEARERDGDYFGPAVNPPARLMQVGPGGQIVLSSAVASLVDGHVRLRDLDGVLDESLACTRAAPVTMACRRLGQNAPVDGHAMLRTPGLVVGLP